MEAIRVLDKLVPNGNKNEEGIYKDGKKAGVWNGWFRNGQKNTVLNI